MDSTETYELFTGPDPLDAIMDGADNYQTNTYDDDDLDDGDSSLEEAVCRGRLRTSVAESDTEAGVLGYETIDLNNSISLLEIVKAKADKRRTEIHPYFYTGPYIQENQQQRRKKRLQCPHVTCKRQFRLEAFYKLHLLSHGNMELECKLCRKVYRDKNQLAKHLSLHHQKDGQLKLFKCRLPSCGHTCFSTTLVRMHEQSQHGQSSFPVRCRICCNSFESRATYVKHMYQHNTMTTATTCKCLECGKHFANSSDLKTHAKRHTLRKEFSCDLCGVEFKRLSNLKRHKNIHKGKNYFCTICSASFSYRISMTKHLVISHPIASNKTNNSQPNKLI